MRLQGPPLCKCSCVHFWAENNLQVFIGVQLVNCLRQNITRPGHANGRVLKTQFWERRRLLVSLAQQAPIGWQRQLPHTRSTHRIQELRWAQVIVARQRERAPSSKPTELPTHSPWLVQESHQGVSLYSQRTNSCCENSTNHVVFSSPSSWHVCAFMLDSMDMKIKHAEPGPNTLHDQCAQSRKRFESLTLGRYILPQPSKSNQRTPCSSLWDGSCQTHAAIVRHSYLDSTDFPGLVHDLLPSQRITFMVLRLLDLWIGRSNFLAAGLFDNLDACPLSRHAAGRFGIPYATCSQTIRWNLTYFSYSII